MSNSRKMAYTPEPFTSKSRGFTEIVKTLQTIPVTVLGAYKNGTPIAVDNALNSALNCVERLTKVSIKAPGVTESSREEALGIAWGIVEWLQEFSMANPIENCGGTPGGTGKGSRTYSLDAMIDAGKEPEGGSWSYNDTV